ncbi:MAG: M24 family metallopeptidase [Thermovirgaceae bacterium]
MTDKSGIPETRLGKLRAMMEKTGCDGIILCVIEGLGWQNACYFSGFRGSSAALLVTGTEKLLVTDDRYRLQASEQSDFNIIVQGKRPLSTVVKELLAKKGLKKVGIDGRSLPVATFREIGGASDLEDVSGLLRSIRRAKDPGERENICHAARIAGAALEKVAAGVKACVTENEISAALEFFIKTGGADGGWQDHEFIVASGPRSALPHGRAGKRKIGPGEWATIDFGARFSGYLCDVTRNLFFGEIPKKWQSRHEILLEAQAAAESLVSAGVRAAEVDGAARRIIEEAGYAKQFTHGLGHGIGLDLHEEPYLSPRSEGVLEEGDVITIEPGMYFDGEGGMRVEDDYLVTSGGAECLTSIIPKIIRAGS